MTTPDGVTPFVKIVRDKDGRKIPDSIVGLATFMNQIGLMEVHEGAAMLDRVVNGEESLPTVLSEIDED